jgi:hypothetical protein
MFSVPSSSRLAASPAARRLIGALHHRLELCISGLAGSQVGRTAGYVELDPRGAALAGSPPGRHRTGGVAGGQRHPRRQLPRRRTLPSGLENFPEPAELVTETAGVKAELRQQVGVLAIIGVHLVRELLAGLLSLVVVALALQQLHDLVFADVHERSFPQTGETETPGSALTCECIPGLQPGMRIDVAAGIWLPELLAAGRLADFYVPRWQSAPAVLDTGWHTLSQPSLDRRRRHLADERPATLLLFAGLPAGAGPQPAASRQAGAAVYLTGRTVDAAGGRQPATIGQTAVHAEDGAAAMPLMSHRLSVPGR